MKVFLSYKRSSQPDEGVALELHDCLAKAGHEVFIDQLMVIGADWSRTIDNEIRGSDFLVVLLTEPSSRSEGVLGEVERARSAFDHAGKPRILPVRLAYTGQLPYSLGLHLDALQYSLWRGSSDTARVLEEIQRALEGHGLPAPAFEVTPPAAMSAPPYAAVIPPPGGTLAVDDPFYISPLGARHALEQVRRPPPETTAVIKAPRQMGKSSLLVRLVAAALQEGKRAALLDLQILGNLIHDEGRFYRRFCAMIAEQLDLSAALDSIWDPEAPQPVNCSRFFEKQILPYIQSSMVLALDEAERLIDSPFRDDFYGMLRSWHNLRGNPLKPIWRKLGLIVVISTEPAFLIQSGDQSPFNVVDPTTLTPFAVGEVSRLNEMHGSPLTIAEVSRLHQLVGGLPYLVRKALYAVSPAYGSLTPDELFASATTETGAFRDHLRRFLLLVEEHSDLKRTLAGVVRGIAPGDIRMAYRLQSAGLVTVLDGETRPACELYARYFQRLPL